jgi:hypothetical protein
LGGWKVKEWRLIRKRQGRREKKKLENTNGEFWVSSERGHAGEWVSVSILAR